MDFTKRMNNAIDYIEENLCDNVNYKEAAKRALCSSYYFQRMFGFMAGVSLSEYVRRRRLTLAAFDLQQGTDKIIDIAARYQYESPDAFTRAFSSMHGLTPTQARKTNLPLKAYPRISFHISIKGDEFMNYRLEQKESFHIVGLRKRFQAPQESGVVKPAFWNDLFANGTWDYLNKMAAEQFPGVHGYIKVIDDETVDYAIGCVSNQIPPEGMVKITIPASTWAVFELVGPPNCSMGEGWQRIFSEWLPTSGYQLRDIGELECFPYEGDRLSENFKSEIWIPIEK